MIEHAAGELVRAGLDGDVAEPDAKAAVLRIEAVAHDAEFADLLDRGTDLRQRATRDLLGAAAAVDEYFSLPDGGAVRARVESRATGEPREVLQQGCDVALGADDDDRQIFDELLIERG